jgi:hypothetical protein
MVFFHNKNPNLGIFYRALEWKMPLYFIALWNYLWPFGTFYWQFGMFSSHLVYFSQFWYVVPRKIWQPWF